MLFFTHKLAQTFFAIFLCAATFQMHTIIYDGGAYSSGLFSSMSTFALYFSDITLILALIFYIPTHYQTRKNFSFGFFWITFGLIIIFSFIELSFWGATDKYLVFWHSIRFLELFLVYLLVINNILPIKTIVFILIINLGLQSLIALGQAYLQIPIGLHFFGEPYFNQETLGIAKIKFLNTTLVRPYGTLPHPNVLGGLLFMTFILIGFVKESKLINPLRIIILFGLLITVSRSAILALVISILFFIFFLKTEYQSRAKIIKKILIFISIGIFIYILNSKNWAGDPSFEYRFWYLNIAQSMIFDHPLGVGSGNFILTIPNYTILKLFPWEYQPVHNIYFLIAAELGICATLFFIVFIGGIFYYLWQKSYFPEIKILLTLFIGLMLIIFNCDHYFWTIYPGQVFFFLYLSLCSYYLNKLDKGKQLRLFNL